MPSSRKRQRLFLVGAYGQPVESWALQSSAVRLSQLEHSDKTEKNLFQQGSDYSLNAQFLEIGIFWQSQRCSAGVGFGGAD